MCKWWFSSHAYDQVEERFPGLNIHDELDDLILLGGQCGDSKAYLTKSDAVIIVEKDKIVVTVMAKNMYMANMASKVSCRSMDCSVLLPSAPLVKNLKPAPLTYFEKQQLKAEGDQKKKANLAKVAAQRQLEKEQKEKQASLDRKAKLKEILRPLAEKDLADDTNNQKQPYETKKERHAKLKELGHSGAARELYESIYLSLYLGAKKLGER